MKNQTFDNMSFHDGYESFIKTVLDNRQACIDLKNHYFKTYVGHAHQRLMDILQNGGIDSPRETRIFFNVGVNHDPIWDAKIPHWRPRLIFTNESLANVYGFFLVPCGEPGLPESWAFLAAVYDENLEAYSTLCCNGFRTYKSE